MRISPLIRFASILLLASLACNQPTATPERQDQPQESGEEGAGTQPPAQPTEPPPPTDTPTPGPPTETATPTATEGPNFGAASIYAVSHLPGDRLMVTVQIPGGVEGSYSATTATSNQTCEKLPEYQDRLYCTGPEPFENYSTQSAIFRLFSVGQIEPVYETNFNIPPRPAPTPTYTKTPEPTATFFIITLVPITLVPFPITLVSP